MKTIISILLSLIIISTNTIACDLPEVSPFITLTFNGEHYLYLDAEQFIIQGSNDCAVEVSFHNMLGQSYPSHLFRSHLIGDTVDLELRISPENQNIYFVNVKAVLEGIPPPALTIYFEEVNVSKNELVDVRIWSGAVEQMISMQFGVSYKNASFEGLYKNGVMQSGLDIAHLQNKYLNFLWVDPFVQPINISEEDDWFTLRFRSQIDGSIEDLIDFDDFITVGEIGYFDNDLINVYSIEFDFEMTGRLATSIKEEQNGLFQLYPNPARDIIYIQSDVESPFDYHIYDVEGRSIYTGYSSKGKVDVSVLESGQYILQVFGDHTMHTKSFIKL